MSARETQHTPEPWRKWIHDSEMGQGDVALTIRDYARAVACVNALAGIADPEAFVENAKRAEQRVKQLRSSLWDLLHDKSMADVFASRLLARLDAEDAK